MIELPNELQRADLRPTAEGSGSGFCVALEPRLSNSDHPDALARIERRSNDARRMIEIGSGSIRENARGVVLFEAETSSRP